MTSGDLDFRDLPVAATDEVVDLASDVALQAGGMRFASSAGDYPCPIGLIRDSRRQLRRVE